MKKIKKKLTLHIFTDFGEELSSTSITINHALHEETIFTITKAKEREDANKT